MRTGNNMALGISASHYMHNPKFQNTKQLLYRYDSTPLTAYLRCSWQSIIFEYRLKATYFILQQKKKYIYKIHNNFKVSSYIDENPPTTCEDLRM